MCVTRETHTHTRQGDGVGGGLTTASTGGREHVADGVCVCAWQPAQPRDCCSEAFGSAVGFQFVPVGESRDSRLLPTRRVPRLPELGNGSAAISEPIVSPLKLGAGEVRRCNETRSGSAARNHTARRSWESPHTARGSVRRRRICQVLHPVRAEVLSRGAARHRRAGCEGGFGAQLCLRRPSTSAEATSWSTK